MKLISKIQIENTSSHTINSLKAERNNMKKQLKLFAFTALWLLFLNLPTNAISNSEISPGPEKNLPNLMKAKYHSVNQSFTTTMGRPGKVFTRWLNLDDDLGELHFLGSVTLKALGSNGVSSVLIKARGKNPEDSARKKYHFRDAKPEETIFTHVTEDGVRYSVKVKKGSKRGKTFEITATGDLIVTRL
ncbi:MAG: hypothetical protein CVV64_05615 [Candidatus Wallbacteria bacterium HGW-Wallbacteria-1]|uniref:Uncharacterized protein n=1 Tax=Candidatus Wallbacteria bacterium HGW-Wallbacteria-1 TaxID=2013854 RepID=A0A2N1PSC7_9BACT|nr:MAG: hypothetical protein CVV64_05615 [Candidatus Wallbacteria bacterium HGW-Wallbacteria-1]